MQSVITVNRTVEIRFNPCFNGFMDKCFIDAMIAAEADECFNPCFNGFMDKCDKEVFLQIEADMFQPLF